MRWGIAERTFQKAQLQKPLKEDHVPDGRSIKVIFGLDRGYIGKLEKKMETTI